MLINSIKGALRSLGRRDGGKGADYVFVSDDVRVLRYGALTDSRDRSFFSDHLPVLVTLQLVNR